MVKIMLKLGFVLPQKLFFFFPTGADSYSCLLIISRAKGHIAAWRCERCRFFNAHCCTDSHTISTFSYGPAYYSICFSAFLSRYLLSAAYFDPAFTSRETSHQDVRAFISHRAGHLGNLPDLWMDNKLVLFPYWYDFMLSELCSFTLSQHCQQTVRK